MQADYYLDQVWQTPSDHHPFPPLPLAEEITKSALCCAQVPKRAAGIPSDVAAVATMERERETLQWLCKRVVLVRKSHHPRPVT